MSNNSIKDFFSRLSGFFDGPWIKDEPQQLDDTAHYGYVADRIARATGYHPSGIKAALDGMEKQGIDISEENLDALIARFQTPGVKASGLIYIKD